MVGLLSNGFTKEQMEKIKELLATLKPVATNKLVVTDIKKTIKEDKFQTTQVHTASHIVLPTAVYWLFRH